MTSNRTVKKKSARPTTNYRLLTFESGTLGIDFRDNIVTNVVKNGQADSMGVRAGWRILEVGGHKAIGARAVMNAVKMLKKNQTRFDILFATPNWVKIAIPVELGDGFLTMKVVDGSKVYQLKKQILKKCKATRVITSPKNGIKRDLHHSCFVITDGTKELPNDEIFEPWAHNLGTTRLVRVMKIRKSRKDKSASHTEKKEDTGEKKPPPMVSLTGGDSEIGNIVEESRVKMEFVRVTIPPAQGGGFITLRVKVGTSQTELQKLAKKKIGEKRGSQVQVLNIDMNEMKINDSRVQGVIPKKKRRPKNNIELKCEMLLDAMQFCKLKDLRITFTPGLIGIGWRGNRVTAVLPQSQAERAGVCPGWEVLAVNGQTMPNDADTISAAIHETKDAGKNTELLFAPNKLPPGTEVVLENLKRNARLNGMTAQILKCLNDNKYDITILNANTRISVRGISGNYFKMKNQQQCWRVVNASGVKIYQNNNTKSKSLGYLRYDTVVNGVRADGWLKHKKGFSRLSSGEVQFLGQTVVRKYGVVWPLSYKRKELYFQNSRAYDKRRRDVATMTEIANRRQQELEEADMKKSENFTPTQWNAFWAKRNAFFSRYYKYLATGHSSESKKKKSSKDKSPDQIEMPKGYAAFERFSEDAGPIPTLPGTNDGKEEEGVEGIFDLLTDTGKEEVDLTGIFGSPTDDPFADKPLEQQNSADPFGVPSDPFAEKSVDPFEEKSGDPFGNTSQNQQAIDPFGDTSEDPFASGSNDPFAQPNDPFAVPSPNHGSLDPFTQPPPKSNPPNFGSNDPFGSEPFGEPPPNDPFADPSGDPFADEPNDPFGGPPIKSNKKSRNSKDEFLSNFFPDDTALVSS